MDLGAEGFVVRGQAATSMLAELGLRTAAPHGRPWLFLPPLAPGDGEEPSGWALHRFPDDAYLGIPADPLASDVVAIIGETAARRAAQDADLPGTVGTGPEDPADLASFVTARMGTSRCRTGPRRSWTPTASSWPAQHVQRCASCGGFPGCPRAPRT